MQSNNNLNNISNSANLNSNCGFDGMMKNAKTNENIEMDSYDKNNFSYLQNQNQNDYQEENDEFLNYEKLKKDYQLHFDDEEE